MADAIIFSGPRRLQGTLAQMLAHQNPEASQEFYVLTGTGAGNKYEYRGATAGWVQTHDASGAALVSDGALAVKITQSGGYTYIGEAVPGTAQATAAWRCQRIDSTGTTIWADGNGNFDNVATDLTALSYS